MLSSVAEALCLCKGRDSLFLQLGHSSHHHFQASLPHLLIPSLTSTGTKYLESIRPHLSNAKFKSTKAIIHTFITSPQFAQLQHQPGMQNWLADWWNGAAYMGYLTLSWSTSVTSLSTSMTNADGIWPRGLFCPHQGHHVLQRYNQKVKS
jgi:hypothetical protein